jgi:hypothetical protein
MIKQYECATECRKFKVGIDFIREHKWYERENGMK